MPGSGRQPAGGHDQPVRRGSLCQRQHHLTGRRLHLRQRQHRDRQYDRRVRPARGRLADPDPRFTVRRWRRGPRQGPGLSGRDPGNQRRQVPAGCRRRQQPDLGPAHHRGRRAGACRPAGVIWRHHAGKRRGLRDRPGLRRELRRWRQRLLRLQAESRRQADPGPALDGHRPR